MNLAYRVLALFLLPIAAFAAPVIGSGVPKTETRDAKGFHAIALAIPASVEIREGASEGVSITGDDNVVPLVETKVANGVLEIRWVDRGADVRPHKIDIVVDAKAVDAITIGGAGRIHAASLSARSPSATIGGSGQIAVDKLEADALKATIGGSGQLVVAGRADNLEAAIAGSGRLSAEKLQTRSAQIAMQGSPEAAVRVKDALAVTVAGSGVLTYYGKPKVTQAVMGSGTIRNAGE